MHCFLFVRPSHASLEPVFTNCHPEIKQDRQIHDNQDIDLQLNMDFGICCLTTVHNKNMIKVPVNGLVYTPRSRRRGGVQVNSALRSHYDVIFNVRNGHACQANQSGCMVLPAVLPAKCRCSSSNGSRTGARWIRVLVCNHDKTQARTHTPRGFHALHQTRSRFFTLTVETRGLLEYTPWRRHG